MRSPAQPETEKDTASRCHAEQAGDVSHDFYRQSPSRKVRLHATCGLCGLLLAAAASRADVVGGLLDEYRNQGATTFSAQAGAVMWRRQYDTAGESRACTRCHGEDLRQAGQHAITGKAIEPLAPSVNAERLSERREIEKWLGRNCQWTLGRRCTPQEKGDLLSYIATQ